MQGMTEAPNSDSWHVGVVVSDPFSEYNADFAQRIEYISVVGCLCS